MTSHCSSIACSSCNCNNPIWIPIRHWDAPSRTMWHTTLFDADWSEIWPIPTLPDVLPTTLTFSIKRSRTKMPSLGRPAGVCRDLFSWSCMMQDYILATAECLSVCCSPRGPIEYSCKCFLCVLLTTHTHVRFLYLHVEYNSRNLNYMILPVVET